MKAVYYEQYGNPEVLKTGTFKKPTPSDHEVIIEVGASSANPVDTYFRSGVRPVSSFPKIPHFDVAGTIVEVGKEVRTFKKGDKVWGSNIKDGTACEYVSVDPALLFPLPEHISCVDGAAIAMPFLTAHLSLFYRARLQPKETVLIYGGSGAVGHAAIQLAKYAQATVIATAGDRKKAQLAKEAGADEVILYKEKDVVKETNKLTNHHGVDVIIDMSLSENIEQNLDVIRTAGRIVSVGSPKDNTPQLPWRKLNQKNAALLGVLVLSAPYNEYRKAGEEITHLQQKRKILAHVAKTYPFLEAATAHQALEGREHEGNIVLVPDEKWSL
ncbi:NADPH:quinone reductase [Texcoconibacillus texcoconensis]|uniref:NADPH2:quinone reductase n=1 Tax=Texcoconibacillus texcoconensis TaxID=1095777 RepID=A0A840QUV0_9BACI|nr:NADPH:quinone reductase [Texcoconibacillus texcoconensis]MBB5175059.1 NADPH2:quinone reductase [Texcoconibacillus texcoconensis]